jgi:hypothetical protein
VTFVTTLARFSARPLQDPARALHKPPRSPLVDEISDLAVTKDASPSLVTLGGVVTCRITVPNLGPDPANAVAVTDQQFGAVAILSARSTAGHCSIRPRVVCVLGSLRAGRRAVVTVKVRPTRATTRLVDRAVAGTTSTVRTLANNSARAAVRVVAPPRPPGFTG